MTWWLLAVPVFSLLAAAIVFYAIHGENDVTAEFKSPFFRFFFESKKRIGRPESVRKLPRG
jgi:hypothetical protein